MDVQTGPLYQLNQSCSSFIQLSEYGMPLLCIPVSYFNQFPVSSLIHLLSYVPLIKTYMWSNIIWPGTHSPLWQIVRLLVRLWQRRFIDFVLLLTEIWSCWEKAIFVALVFLGLVPRSTFPPSLHCSVLTSISASPVSLGQMTCSWVGPWENGSFRRPEHGKKENSGYFFLLFVLMSLFCQWLSLSLSTLPTGVPARIFFPLPLKLKVREQLLSVADQVSFSLPCLCLSPAASL